ncbi:MAG: YCF48-related protein [Rhodothermales bacterium]
MSILLLALLAGFAQIVYAQNSTWTLLPLPFDNGALDDLHFTDKDTGWAVGFDADTDDAVILHTTNQGDDWTLQPAGFDGFLDGVFFVDDQTGYAVGKNFDGNEVIILKTSNGGTQWQPQAVPEIGGTLFDVHLTGAVTGWAVGIDADALETLILHTTDGATWTQSAHPEHTGQLNAVYFADAATGWAVGKDDTSGAAVILATTDGGQTWVEQAHPVAAGNLRGVFFLDTQMGWAVGTTGSEAILLATTDGGATWAALSPPQMMEAIVVSFISPLHGYMATNLIDGNDESTTLYKTTDGGTTWEQILNTLTGYTHSMAIVEGSLWAFIFGSSPTGSFGSKADITPASQLTSIEIAPTNVNMQVNDSQVFTATGKDPQGNTATITNPEWQVDGGGTLTPSGFTATFTATTPGNYTITCREAGTTIQGSAAIHISGAPQLTSIEIAPTNVNMQVNDSQVFTATGKDPQGNTATITNPEWQVDGGGTLTPSGFTATFTATTPGNYMLTCREAGTTIQGSAAIHITTATGVDEQDEDLPTVFALAPNYPNPAHGVTAIAYALPEATPVRLVIYNVLGQRVQTLVEREQPPGIYRVL